MIIRAVLLILYIIVSFLVVVYFAKAGDESYASSAILYSWGIIPWQHGLAQDMFGFFIVPPLYLLGVFFLNTIPGKTSNVWIAAIPMILHAVGVAVAIIGMEHGYVDPWFIIESFLISLPLAFLYFVFDFKLSRRAQQSLSGDSLTTAPEA